ncbi:MAG: preprotein translocase subunit SecY [Acidothermus sp.]|nr:preprotein translocase subunit SecY [Acidothermus sp.]MCL6538192.1 preprotein translocase subunit SecY [Acidothermus sp.]
MLTAFVRAFRTPDLRKKLLFVLFIIVLFRIGSAIPTPGVSSKNINTCLQQVSQGSAANIYTLINLFSGGALLKLSILALGIMPYITSSIIIQLLVVVIPRLERLKEEGGAGQQKLTQYTRYLTIGLAVLQSAAFVALARTPGAVFTGCSLPIIPNTSLGVIITMVIIMTAGTGIIMWLGELITDRGIGNGMSLLIFTQIAARFPAELNTIRQNKGNATFIGVLVVGIAIITAIVFMEQGQRRIPVQYAKRMIGRRMYGGTSTYIPLKVNQAGVIPVIFASSLLYIPSLAAKVWGSKHLGFTNFVNNYLSPGSPHPTYLLAYFALIIFFTFFYVAITFNPDEVAENMKKYGGFIPGIRPGRPTAEYLSYVLSRITVPGATYLALISVLPELALSIVGSAQAFPFGGTSVLILVGVGLDTVKQIESQLMLRNYEGFLR